jgi:hypothetical protein
LVTNRKVTPPSLVYTPLEATSLLLTGSSYNAVVLHFGTPEDDDEGLAGFEEVAKSFQFE